MFESYDDLVTIEDLREMLGIGKNAAYELLQRNLIKSFHIGRSWKNTFTCKAELKTRKPT